MEGLQNIELFECDDDSCDSSPKKGYIGQSSSKTLNSMSTQCTEYVFPKESNTSIPRLTEFLKVNSSKNIIIGSSLIKESNRVMRKMRRTGSAQGDNGKCSEYTLKFHL